MSKIDNLNLEKLRATVGTEKAEKIFAEVAEVGGWGKVDPEYRGGLDLKGMREAGKDASNPNREDCAKRAAEIDRILSTEIKK